MLNAPKGAMDCPTTVVNPGLLERLHLADERVGIGGFVDDLIMLLVDFQASLPSLIFALAILAAVIVWVIQTRTTLGFEIRAVGQNPEAARFAGMPVNAVLVKTALLSGGLAALAGWSEVAGLRGHLSSDLSPGFGYTGITVAMLALLHPLGVVLTAVFVAGIFVGSDAMSRAAGVPTYIADMLMATALLFMVLAILLTKVRVVRG